MEKGATNYSIARFSQTCKFHLVLGRRFLVAGMETVLPESYMEEGDGYS